VKQFEDNMFTRFDRIYERDGRTSGCTYTARQHKPRYA